MESVFCREMHAVFQLGAVAFQLKPGRHGHRTCHYGEQRAHSDRDNPERIARIRFSLSLLLHRGRSLDARLLIPTGEYQRSDSQMTWHRTRILVLAMLVCAPLPAAADRGTQPLKANDAERKSILSDLPLVDVPAKGDTRHLAVFYSGDGGWATLDTNVSKRLADAGVNVTGVNSLRYFWSNRPPDRAAQDLARILREKLRTRPAGDKVLLIGYSTGADVLPFIVNRLPEDLVNRIASVSLIAPGHDAVFEIHVRDWIPGSRKKEGLPLMPEIARLPPPVLCLYGEGDKDALCPELPAEQATTVLIGTGHHLGGDYEAIANRILTFASSKAG